MHPIGAGGLQGFAGEAERLGYHASVLLRQLDVLAPAFFDRRANSILSIVNQRGEVGRDLGQQHVYIKVGHHSAGSFHERAVLSSGFESDDIATFRGFDERAGFQPR